MSCAPQMQGIFSLPRAAPFSLFDQSSVSMDMSHSSFNASLESSESTTLKIAELQAKLNRKLGPEYISTRPGPGGGPKLTYAEGWKIINLANEVFGFNGWSTSITNVSTDFIDFSEETRRYSVGVSAVVRVTLRDGVYHEDIGYGVLENSKSKGAALDKCKKEAVTDAVKRTLRNFGNLLGNCLYDKQYTQEVVKMKPPIPKFNKDELHRRSELDESTKTHVSSNAPPNPAMKADPKTSPILPKALGSASTSKLNSGIENSSIRFPTSAHMAQNQVGASSTMTHSRQPPLDRERSASGPQTLRTQMHSGPPKHISADSSIDAANRSHLMEDKHRNGPPSMVQIAKPPSRPTETTSHKSAEHKSIAPLLSDGLESQDYSFTDDMDEFLAAIAEAEAQQVYIETEADLGRPLEIEGDDNDTIDIEAGCAMQRHDPPVRTSHDTAVAAKESSFPAPPAKTGDAHFSANLSHSAQDPQALRPLVRPPAPIRGMNATSAKSDGANLIENTAKPTAAAQSLKSRNIQSVGGFNFPPGMTVASITPPSGAKFQFHGLKRNIDVMISSTSGEIPQEVGLAQVLKAQDMSGVLDRRPGRPGRQAYAPLPLGEHDELDAKRPRK